MLSRVAVKEWSAPTRRFTRFFQFLVHGSVRGDVINSERHRSFIAAHLFGGLIALAIIPFHILRAEEIGLLSLVLLAWSATPVAIAIFLSRSGLIGLSHLASSASLAVLVTIAALLTGGISSFALVWLIVVPLEAAISAERRVVVWSIMVACTSLVLIYAAGVADLLPPAQMLAMDSQTLTLIGIVTAILYAGGLAVSLQQVNARAEAALRDEEERYRLLAENATDMITRHDSAGKILFASHASSSLLGVEPASLHGNGLFDRVHVADRPSFLQALNSCRNGQPGAVEFRVLRENSKTSDEGEPYQQDYVWVEMLCRIVGSPRDNRQREGEVVAVTRDISWRKVHEAELLEARDEAQSANRAKTCFLASMSHELRTPLNAIIGFSDILASSQMGDIDVERRKEYARLIHDSGHHLLDVVNDVLDTSKLEAGRFSIEVKEFAVRPVLESAVEMMRCSAETKSINMTSPSPLDDIKLTADPRACKQILLNLLSNAIKFTPENGAVDLRAGIVDDMLEISVTDTGIGISSEDLPKLGQPFVQIENSYDRKQGGTGLGLSVVKGLVELHGGVMHIESAQNIGTTVSIRLPLKQSSSGDSRTEKPADIGAARAIRQNRSAIIEPCRRARAHG